MSQRIILFNGPPSSGKDTSARACMEDENLRNSHHLCFDRMSMPVKRAFAGMMGVNIDRWGNVVFEAVKDQHNELLGCSYRQWQIDFSEKFMKPFYGEDIFGRLFVNRLARQDPRAVVFVPDCGFNIEYDTLAKFCGSENLLVIKIVRPGTSFQGDARAYLKVGTFGEKRNTEQVMHIYNSGTEDELKSKVLRRVTNWLKTGYV